MISIKQITYALAVAEERHFKRASDSCSVSQSTLSSAISELEQQLGIKLFERDNRQVLVTPIGEQFIERARKIKIDVEDLYRLAEAESRPLSYPMTIGVIPTIGPYLLPKVLPEVRNQHPDFQLMIMEEQSHRLVEMVRNGVIDCAVLALPYAVDGLHTFTFWKEDFYLITHRDESVSEQQEIRSDQINSAELLLLKDGHCLKDHVLAACKLQATETNHSMEGASLYTLIQMAAGHMGSTLVPQMALNQLLFENSELKAVHLSEPGPHRTIAFICRLNYTRVNYIEALMDIFRKQLSEQC
jgi:LysR family transcriptional regulator, hydrogen peroxide-inducible genes activator